MSIYHHLSFSSLIIFQEVYIILNYCGEVFRPAYIEIIIIGYIKVGVSELNEIQLVCYSISIFGRSHLLVSKPVSNFGLILSQKILLHRYILCIFVLETHISTHSHNVPPLLIVSR